MRIHNFLALSPSMTNLRPEMVSSARAGGSPGLQRSPHGRRGLAINDHVTRAFQMVPVNLHIAGQQQSRSAVAPEPIQLIERRCGFTGWGGKPFGHGRLAEPVRNFCATR